MKCTNCNYFIKEPEITHLNECPSCGHLLLIPSRRDWQNLVNDSDIKKLVERKE